VYRDGEVLALPVGFGDVAEGKAQRDGCGGGQRHVHVLETAGGGGGAQLLDGVPIVMTEMEKERGGKLHAQSGAWLHPRDLAAPTPDFEVVPALRPRTAVAGGDGGDQRKRHPIGA